MDKHRIFDHIVFEYFESFHKGLYEWLGDREMNRDDYDYAIFVQCSNVDQMKIQRILIERLLHGCCSNECFYVEDFFGKNGVLGIAYHS